MPSGHAGKVHHWWTRAGAELLRILLGDRVAGHVRAEAGKFSSVFAEELLNVTGAAVPVQEKPCRDRENPGATIVDYSNVDAMPEHLVALCLSGGGIRSASFGLGVLQGLARFGLLDKFHYLSTVSGGGYIGSFLTAWRAHENNDPRVFEKLNRPEHKDGKEAEEVRSIRAFSNYLTPSVGVFSPDTWTAIAIVVRNLLLNWMIFLPFFMAAILLPRLCRDLLDDFAPRMVCGARYFTFAAALSATTGFACASYGRRRSEAKWLTNKRFRWLVVVPLVVASMLLTARTAVLQTHMTCPYFSHRPPAAWLGVGFGVASYVIAWLLASLFLRNRKPPAGTPRNDFRSIVLDVVAWAISGALVGYLVVLGMGIAPLLLRNYATLDNKIDPFLVVAGISWTMLSVLCGELLFVGLRSYSPRGDMDREWLARSAGWLAVVAASWSVFSAVSLFGTHMIQTARFPLLGTAGVSGAIALALGNSAKTAAQAALMVGGRLSFTRIASMAAVTFAVTLTIFVSWTNDVVIYYVAGWFGTDQFDWRLDAGGMILLGIFSIVVSYFVNVNRFSLHALYRNRLVRAFLGSARAGQYDAAAEKNRPRHVDPFTQFAQTDNVHMADMPTNRLLHVVNITLNVVSTRNLAWQQRKAEPFTVTPLSCGNPNVGYRPTKFYGGGHSHPARIGGITLGTAMAISGAAVSPNMGANSSPLLGFLLTLFNLRLGWWLGNPQFPVASLREGPEIGLQPLLQELAGQTTDQSRWVYLSDGGHFDNLGLYEMVRRRCRVIVVSDAGCDPKCLLTDLGDCLRKIYIDLGVSIDFREFDIKARQSPPTLGPYSAIADISYPGAPDKPGWLLYIKPGYHGGERADVRSYAEAHGAFPHEPTGEQWFNESQLESYRALGAHITELLCNHGRRLLPAEVPEELSIADFKTSATTASGSMMAPAA